MAQQAAAGNQLGAPVRSSSMEAAIARASTINDRLQSLRTAFRATIDQHLGAFADSMPPSNAPPVPNPVSTIGRLEQQHDYAIEAIKAIEEQLARLQTL